MGRAGHQFLAGAAFALDEDRVVRGREELQQAQDFEHFGGARDDVREEGLDAPVPGREREVVLGRRAGAIGESGGVKGEGAVEEVEPRRGRGCALGSAVVLRDEEPLAGLTAAQQRGAQVAVAGDAAEEGLAGQLVGAGGEGFSRACDGVGAGGGGERDEGAGGVGLAAQDLGAIIDGAPETGKNAEAIKQLDKAPLVVRAG